MARNRSGSEGGAPGRRRKPAGHPGKCDKRSETLLPFAARKHRLVERRLSAGAQSLSGEFGGLGSQLRDSLIDCVIVADSGVLSWRFPQSGTSRPEDPTRCAGRLGDSDRPGHGLSALEGPNFPHTPRLEKFEW